MKGFIRSPKSSSADRSLLATRAELLIKLARSYHGVCYRGVVTLMNYEVVTKTLSSQTLAAVRRRVLVGNVGTAWKPALDLVWEFLSRQKGLRVDGHNCFLYHQLASGGGELDVDFGVQVIRPFQEEGEVICTETPAG